MQTSLREIAEQAKKDKGRRFTNLNRLLTKEYLEESFKILNRKAAVGIDGVTYQEYKQGQDRNIMELLERVKSGKYHARFVRRKNIKKANGKLRPLGIPTIEDKLLQAAVAQILGAVYEADFTTASYAYRPNRGPKEAIRDLTYHLRRGKYSYVVEADIKGFYDHLEHDWLMKMLDLRIGDGVIKRLIRKWLKAGVVEEDGQIYKPVEGTPQGGVISPVLANVYLHYVLDLWFERRVKRNCEGEAYYLRFADDFVACFQYKRDAEKYRRELGERLKEFNLELAEEKTRINSFSRFRKEEQTRFTFLGIEFRWGVTHSGKDTIRRRTDGKRLKRAIAEIAEWCKENRHRRIRKQQETIKQKLRGHYNYYGIIGNYQAIEQFYKAIMKVWYKWLNRRSQRRSHTWKEFKEITKRHGIPRPKIVELRKNKTSLQLQLEFA
jgi:RNA-directed DNA polymerase